MNRLLVVAAALLLFGVGAAIWLDGRAAPPEPVAASVPKEPMAESVPLRLRVPAIGVDTNFVPLGLEADGEVEVPRGFTEVGWYTYGPAPGALGPAVVLGHVDSKYAPGVFTNLEDVQVGDRIYVDREDGTTAVFEVIGAERYPQDAFPSARVYGNIPYAGIRLITCSGIFSPGIRRYDHVHVVYGRLVES
jgi:hypothetical protein